MRIEQLLETDDAARERMDAEWRRQNEERAFLKTQAGLIRKTAEESGLTEEQVQTLMKSVGVEGKLDWCLFTEYYKIAGEHDLRFKMPHVYSWDMQDDPSGKIKINGQHQRNGKIQLGDRTMYFSVVNHQFVHIGFRGINDRDVYHLVGIVRGAVADTRR